MIGLIKGIILEKGPDTVLVECNGIGYELSIPESTLGELPPVGEEVVLFTHLIWKEDAITLYGFLGREHRDMFRMLIQVSGVGPKMAMSCISVLGHLELLKALSSGDVKRLQAISGIGKKTAARLCVDLKEKAKKMLSARGEGVPESHGLEAGMETGETGGGLWQEAYSALINLGYKPGEIRRVLPGAIKAVEGHGDGKGPSSEQLADIITTALRGLAR